MLVRKDLRAGWLCAAPAAAAAAAVRFVLSCLSLLAPALGTLLPQCTSMASGVMQPARIWCVHGKCGLAACEAPQATLKAGNAFPDPMVAG